jgi:predicted RNA-binding protein with TRAM domain
VRLPWWGGDGDLWIDGFVVAVYGRELP